MDEVNYTAEEWRCITGFPKYEISSHGRVRSLHGRKGHQYVMKQRICRGYWMVNLNQKGNNYRRTHKLIAEAFIGPRPTGLHINHKDGNKLNNHYTNLEYVTPSENTKHAIALNLRSPFPDIKNRARGERVTRAYFTESDIISIRKICALGFPQATLADLLRTYPTTINRIVHRQVWKHIP